MVGYHIFSLSVVPEPGRRGHIEARGNGRPEDYRAADPLTRDVALEAIFYSGAGPAAQSRQRREPLHLTWVLGGSAGDFNASLQWARLFHPSTENAISAVWSIWERTAPLIRCGNAWRAVTAVAEALIVAGSLDGPEVERIVIGAWPDRPEVMALGQLPTLADCLRELEVVA